MSEISVKSKEPQRITFNVYRGEHEAITKVHFNEIRLFPDTFEILMAYDYSSYYYNSEVSDSAPEEERKIIYEDIVRMRNIVPKSGLGICETIAYHPYDIRREHPLSLIILESYGKEVTIRCDSVEAKRLYKLLRHWLLASKS
jgi:hypothetical protein